MKYRFTKKAVLLVTLLLLLLASVGGAAAQDPVTITWWTLASAESPEPAIRAVVEAFEAEHPDIKIDVTIMAESAYGDLMNTALGAGEGAPDIAYFWETPWLPHTLDITAHLEADPDLSRDDYFEEYFNNWAVWDGKVVGLPFTVGANFVMYNKDVFDDAGVDYPTADWTPWDYIEIAKALTDPDKRRWGGDRPRGPFRAIWRNIGATKPYSDDSATVDGYINGPDSVAAYTWLWDLVDSGATPTPADIEVLGTEGTGPVDLFIAGRLGMATLNNGHMITAANAGVNFGVVPEPHVPENERFVHAWALRASIWAGTEHPDEAYEFLSFWAGPEGQRINMEIGALMPSLPAVLADYPDAESDYFQGFMGVLNATQTAEWRASHPCWRGAVIRSVSDAWDLIMLGEIERDEVQATLDALVEPAQAALEECVPRLGG
ncbi:MAG: sugar ABC transporter substrate-binding protein [Chloroflexota bacterium]|nr:sugar ABC transporter substrate-binding protein [Chloroflexota bacterium]MDE2857281.1 sugar ABC transporter substrate-binding protein [Chloroflexota bacterium]